MPLYTGIAASGIGWRDGVRRISAVESRISRFKVGVNVVDDDDPFVLGTALVLSDKSDLDFVGEEFNPSEDEPIALLASLEGLAGLDGERFGDGGLGGCRGSFFDEDRESCSVKREGSESLSLLGSDGRS